MTFPQKIKYLVISIFVVFNCSLVNAKQNFDTCDNTIKRIETQTNIPNGLLHAIGKVESGRFLNKNNHVIWPWTVNHAGKSLFFNTKNQMEKYVLKNVMENDFNIDVGCMQINLKWHKNYFKKINDMFSLEPNISYAASFLIQLKNRHGSWDKAIKHYHSSDPEKNKPYFEKVKSFWKNKEIFQIVKNPKKSKSLKPDNVLISDVIQKTQPYLYERIEKVKFFRKIFALNN